MRKRLVKKLKQKTSYKFGELDELEELLILANRANYTEDGCVFVDQSPHVNLARFSVATSKTNYTDYVKVVEIRRGRLESTNKPEDIKELKQMFISLGGQ